MKSVVSLALILLIAVLPQVSFAEKAIPKNGKAHSVKRSQLGTSFKFDGTSLRGKYNSSMNTAATVENDKLLDDLLKGRTQFEDRADQETERN